MIVGVAAGVPDSTAKGVGLAFTSGPVFTGLLRLTPAAPPHSADVRFAGAPPGVGYVGVGYVDVGYVGVGHVGVDYLSAT